MPQRKLITYLEHDFADIVYLKTDSSQIERMVTNIQISPKLEVLYQLSAGTLVSWHLDIEITDEKDELKKVL